MKTIYLFFTYFFFFFLMNGSWSNTPDMFVLPHEDEVYVYHSRNLPSGHGFNDYRQDGRGGEFILLTEDPVRGIRRADELRPNLGDNFERALRFFKQESAAGLFFAMRSNPIERDIATLVFPEVAKALGRLYIDRSAPANADVTYRIEFVDLTGNPTGVEYTQAVNTQAMDIAVPTITGAENRGRRVTLQWEYPQYPRNNPDYVIQFYLLRIEPQTGEYQLLTDDVIIRNNAQSEYFISFNSPVVNTTEQYTMMAVTFSGYQSDPSPVYTFELIDNIPPDPVSGLASRVSAEQEPVLSWDASQKPGIVGYYVYRSTDMTQDFDRLNDEPISPQQPFFADTTATGGFAYYYYVTVVDEAGNESPMGDMVMAQVADLEAPPRPENLQAVFNPERLEVDLSWEMPEFSENFETFIIMRRREDTASPGAFSRVNMDDLQALSYSDRSSTDIGFPEGALFRYIIFSASRALNYSDTVSALVEIPLLTPPEPPTGLTIVNDNGHRANITWNASPSVSTENYILYRKQEGDDSFSELLRLPADARSVRDEDLEIAKTYVYAVSAIDRADNESDLSEPDTLFFRNFTPPRSVRNIQAAEQEAGVALRWERVAADDLAGYRVYRANISTGRYQTIHDGLLTETSFIDPDGTQEHWYRVRAVDTSGNESRPGTPVRPAGND